MSSDLQRQACDIQVTARTPAEEYIDLIREQLNRAGNAMFSACANVWNFSQAHPRKYDTELQVHLRLKPATIRKMRMVGKKFGRHAGSFSLTEQFLPIDSWATMLELTPLTDPQINKATEKKQITRLLQGESLRVEDVTTSQVESYETLSRIYSLYSTLSGDETLARFDFAVRWHQLEEAERRAKYSEFACHELNLFLSRKDPDFFGKVIQPYLRNKRHKTFLDHYLLEEDLSGYLEPWAYGRLNVVERSLLAGRGSCG